MPWERMHAAAFRYCDCSWGSSGGSSLAPGPPPGSSLRQACCADLKLGIARDRRRDPDRHLHFVAVWSRSLGRGSSAPRARACTPSTRPPGCPGDADSPTRRSSRPPSSSSWTFWTRATRGSPRPRSASRPRSPPRARRGRSVPRPGKPLAASLWRSPCSGHRLCLASPCMSSPLQLERSCSGLLVRHRRFREGIAARAVGAPSGRWRNRAETAGK